MRNDEYYFDNRRVEGLGDFTDDGEEWIEFDDYQRAAQRTAQYPKELGLYYTALGLASEAGEFAGKVKKVMRDSNGEVTKEMKEALVAELGDCAWYVAMAAKELGAPLSRVARLNLEKLASRKKRGVIGGSGDAR